MYNLFYNFNDSPFGLEPDLKYFFNTSSHKRAIEHMHIGFEKPDGVLVLTGKKGMGKTTLITHMLEQLDKDDNIVAFLEEAPQKEHDFLPAILTALQIPITDNQPKVLFSALHNFLREQASLNKKVMLVVDGAETFSHNFLEFIRLLSTLRLNERGLLQTVLVGTNKLEETLLVDDNQAFRQQVTMSCSIQSLEVSDTREYIEHRLKVAGWSNAPIIDEDAFGAIHQLAEGIPYAINRCCDRLLVQGMLCKTHHITSKDVFNLTSETMEKLEKFEAVQQELEKRMDSAEKIIEQPLPSFTEPQKQKAEPVQQVDHVQQTASQTFQQTANQTRGNDVEETMFSAPAKESKPFFNKQVIITIAAAYLISSISIIAYDRMTGNNSPATNVSHSAAPDHSGSNNHSAAPSHSGSNNHSASNNSHSGGHESAASGQSSSETAKYVLMEMPAAAVAEARLGNAESEAQLLNIQSLLKNLQESGSDANLATEVVSDASVASF